MSTFDASASTQGFDMFDLTAIDWASLGNALTGNYSYFTDDAHDIDLFDTVGGGFTYDGSMNPTGGTVSNGQIDLNDDDFLDPDVTFTGSFDLVALTNGGASGNGFTFYDLILDTTDDTVTGSAFGDTLKGLGGDDSISGGDGDDEMDGDDGDDILQGGNGSDSLNGDVGFDIADFSDGAAAISIDLSTQTVSGGDTIIGFEGAYGSMANDTMTGSAGNNALKGVGGADTISGGDAGDTLFGGADNDVLDGGKGFDALLGEEGNDVLRGKSNGDLLKGLGGDDLLVGGGGIDSLDGGDGNDVMRGNQGVDELHGGDDDDVMAGRGGADSLSGGAGDDLLTGKGGADNYFFEQFGSQTDTIRSFTPGVGGDVITLVGFDATFDTFTEVMAAMTTDGVSTTIDFGAGDILIIKGVTPGAFDASDFAFI